MKKKHENAIIGTLVVIVVASIILFVVVVSVSIQNTQDNIFEYGKSGEWYRNNHIKIIVDKTYNDDQIRMLLEVFLTIRRDNSLNPVD